MLGKLRRSGRGGLVEKQWQSLEERSSTGTRLGHPVLTRWVLHLAGDMSPHPSPHLPPVRHTHAPHPRCSCPGEVAQRPLVCTAGSAGSPTAHPCLLLPPRSKTCDPSFCTDTEQAAVATGRQGNPSPSVSLEAQGSGGFTQPQRHGPGWMVSAGQVPGEGPSWFRGRGGDAAGGLRGACGARALPQAPCHASPTPRPPLQLSKRTASYRKAFGELTEREELLACFSCAWQREVPYHGRLYITSHHVCFYSSLLLKDIKVGWGRVRGQWLWRGAQAAARDMVMPPGPPWYRLWFLSPPSQPSRRPTRRSWCPTHSASALPRGRR